MYIWLLLRVCCSLPEDMYTYCSLSVLSFCPSSIHLISNTRHLDGTFAWYTVSFACFCSAAWVSGTELYYLSFYTKRCNLASSTLEWSYIVTWHFPECFKSWLINFFVLLAELGDDFNNEVSPGIFQVYHAVSFPFPGKTDKSCTGNA